MTTTPSSQSSAHPEQLTGSGTVLRGTIPVMTVDYELTVASPHDREQTYESGHEPRDTVDITGRLLGSLFTAESLAGADHTLVLADGRAFDFRVIQPDTNEIVGVSAFRPAGTAAAAPPRSADRVAPVAR